MKPIIRLIEDEDYPEDDIAPEYDFAALHERAKVEGREYIAGCWRASWSGWLLM